MKRAIPKPPDGLSEAAKNTWRKVNNVFVLEDHQLELLRVALEARDLADKCKAQIDREGLLIAGARGSVAHPLLSVMRDARNLFSQNWRRLDLHLPGGES